MSTFMGNGFMKVPPRAIIIRKLIFLQYSYYQQTQHIGKILMLAHWFLRWLNRKHFMSDFSWWHIWEHCHILRECHEMIPFKISTCVKIYVGFRRFKIMLWNIISVWRFNPYPAKYIYFLFFNHLRLRLATAIHNLKWLKITPICFILRPNIYKSWCLSIHFNPDNRLIKLIKNDLLSWSADKR